MATITLKGNPIQTTGELPANGAKSPDFKLVANDLSPVSLDTYKGYQLVLNIFPSVDTGICAMSVHAFNKEVAARENTKVLCISRDLPFAQARFCGAEGIQDAITLSDFANGSFGRDYGVTIADGPMKDLHSRAVIVLNENHEVVYSEQVPEIVQEPDYKSALAALK